MENLQSSLSSPLGQLMPDQGRGNMPNYNQSLFDRMRQFALAALMTQGQPMGQQQQMPQQQPMQMPQQQQQQMMQAPQMQQMVQQQNPGLGSISPPQMSPQQTGLTPQIGSIIGGALRNYFGGGQ